METKSWTTMDKSGCWPDHLPEEAVREMLAEMLSAIEMGLALDPLIAAWKSTAEVYADPDLYRTLTTPTGGDFGVVLPPPTTKDW